MAYARKGKIEAIDYNDALLGPPNAKISGLLYSVLGVGNSTAGYGQPGLTNVVVGNSVEITEWITLIDQIATIASHQNSSIIAITPPTSGSDTASSNDIRALIKYLDSIPTNLATIYRNRLNAASQGTHITTTVTSSSTFIDHCTFEFEIKFDTADQARYFFNTGGQLALTFSHPTGSGIDAQLYTLGTLMGTCIFSSAITETIRIAGTNYTGFKKSGGIVSPILINTSRGYYGLPTTNDLSTVDNNIKRQRSLCIQQNLSDSADYFQQSRISLCAYTNGTQSGNQDNGNTIYLSICWEEVPSKTYASAGTAVALTVRPPTTSHGLSQTWGIPTVTGITYADTIPKPFSAGGTIYPAPWFEFNDIISSDTTNYNLKEAAIAAGWNKVVPIIATVTINSGVIVGATTSDRYAFDTGADFPSSTGWFTVESALTIINNGYIVGHGGAGGSYGFNRTGIPSDFSDRTGGPGGSALLAQFRTTVINNGLIAGGGGGGGTGSFTSAHIFGGGGGGAGYYGGIGGGFPRSFYNLYDGSAGYINRDPTPPETKIFWPGSPGTYAGWGGDLGKPGQGGQFSQNPSLGGGGGAAGYAIDGISNISFGNSGTIVGPMK
jgi:hypothetical protein